MREIKFRAYNTEKKVMVYRNEDSSETYWDGCHCSPIQLVNGRLDNYSGEYIWEQYTGLKDKNGVEIYEGDILKVVEDWGKGKTCEFIYVVEWNLCKVYIRQIRPFTHSLDLLDFMNDEDCFPTTVEIIGNIHDNPELLKG